MTRESRSLIQQHLSVATEPTIRREIHGLAGTTIVGGALAYRTRMRHAQFYARVKMRADGMDWEAAPTLLSEQQTTALTDHVIALAGGLNERGSDRRIKISRVVKGKLTELSVNLEDKIQPGDTITISGRFF